MVYNEQLRQVQDNLDIANILTAAAIPSVSSREPFAPVSQEGGANG
jgi:hypothetical protein